MSMTACIIKLVIPPERVCFQHHLHKKSSWYLDSNCIYSSVKNAMFHFRQKYSFTRHNMQ